MLVPLRSTHYDRISGDSGAVHGLAQRAPQAVPKGPNPTPAEHNTEHRHIGSRDGTGAAALPFARSVGTEGGEGRPPYAGQHWLLLSASPALTPACAPYAPSMHSQGLRVLAIPGGAAGQDPGTHPVASSPVPQSRIGGQCQNWHPRAFFFSPSASQQTKQEGSQHTPCAENGPNVR